MPILFGLAQNFLEEEKIIRMVMKVLKEKDVILDKITHDIKMIEKIVTARRELNL